MPNLTRPDARNNAGPFAVTGYVCLCGSKPDGRKSSPYKAFEDRERLALSLEDEFKPGSWRYFSVILTRRQLIYSTAL